MFSDKLCGAAKNYLDKQLALARKTKDEALDKLLAAFNPKSATYDIVPLLEAKAQWDEGERIAKAAYLAVGSTR